MRRSASAAPAGRIIGMVIALRTLLDGDEDRIARIVRRLSRGDLGFRSVQNLSDAPDRRPGLGPGLVRRSDLHLGGASSTGSGEAKDAVQPCPGREAARPGAARDGSE